MECVLARISTHASITVSLGKVAYQSKENLSEFRAKTIP